jgi:hypothetical protein
MIIIIIIIIALLSYSDIHLDVFAGFSSEYLNPVFK